MSVKIIGMVHTEISYFHGWPDAQFNAWLAGFFDGEGCVYLPKGPGVELTMASTRREVIQAIHARLGVGYIEVTEFTNQPNWNTKYLLRIRRYEDARNVLLKMRPYLTIKTDKADTAIRRIVAFVERRRATLDKHADVRTLAKRKFTHQQIADKVGLSRTRVTQILNAPPSDDAVLGHPAGERLFHRTYQHHGTKRKVRATTTSVRQ